MKIRELLEAIEPKKSNLPSAPSLNDPIEEPNDEVDGEEDGDDESDEDSTDDSGDVEKIKSIGSSLGDDLYSVTVYNTTDDFANIEQVTSHTWKLEDFGSPVVKSYLSQSDNDISNEKTISCVIYNSRNGEFFRFNSGETGSGFEPNLHSLVSSGVIDSDQVNVLRDIESIGNKYHRALGNVSWKAGQEAEGRGASQLYNVLSRLKDALNLREPVERIHNVSISDEQRAKNKAYTQSSIDDWKKYKAEREKQGSDREKR